MDRGIESYPIGLPGAGSTLSPRMQSGVVTELKYAPDAEAGAARIWALLGLRLARNSKYLNGLPSAALY